VAAITTMWSLRMTSRPGHSEAAGTVWATAHRIFRPLTNTSAVRAAGWERTTTPKALGVVVSWRTSSCSVASSVRAARSALASALFLRTAVE